MVGGTEQGSLIDQFDIGDMVAQEGAGINPNKEPEAKEEQEDAAEDES